MTDLTQLAVSIVPAARTMRYSFLPKAHDYAMPARAASHTVLFQQ
ncbi:MULTISPECIES: hypothetical protein [Brucella]|nr:MULTISPECIES: hypothetical protein [Brucella]